jgi:predicted transcriptional regulator
MFCPACSYDNIEGMDRCANCMEPLRDLDIPRAEATTGIVRSVMEDSLAELEHEDAISAQASESAGEVMRRLNEAKRECAIIFDDGKLAGVFTERDVWQAMSGRDHASMSIGDVMTRKPETLRATDTVASALALMSIGQRRHLLITDGESQNYKIISAKAILKYIAERDW